MEPIFSERSCKDCNQHDSNFCVPPAQVKIDKRGLGPLLLEKLQQHPDTVLQVNSETGQTETCGEFLSRVICVAQKMKSLGVESGDIISFCTWNNMDCYVPFIATLVVNAITAPLDPALALHDTIYLLQLMKPKLIFCDEDGAPVIESALADKPELETKIVIFGETDKHLAFSQFLESKGDENGFEATPAKNIQDTALISFSSGTTDRPKGVCLSHSSVLYQLCKTSIPNRFYSVTRLCWIAGTAVSIHCIASAGSWLIARDFDTKSIFKIIEDFKVTCVSLPPLYACKLIENAEHCIHNTSSLQILHIAGGTVSKTQMQALRKLFPTTYVSSPYGATETIGTIITFNIMDETQRHEMRDKPLAMGHPSPGNCIKIVDVNTGDIVTTPHKSGEIRVKSVTLINGYYNDAKLTEASFDSDGYYCTGDVGYFDEDYCFFYEDRIKDLMKYQGWTLSPVEIESVLLTHPAIAEASVIAVPHDEDGSHPMGIIVLKKGLDVKENDIIKYVEDKVTDPKRLRGGVKIVDNIPKTPSFKLRRRDLRNTVLEGVL